MSFEWLALRQMSMPWPGMRCCQDNTSPAPLCATLTWPQWSSVAAPAPAPAGRRTLFFWRQKLRLRARLYPSAQRLCKLPAWCTARAIPMASMSLTGPGPTPTNSTAWRITPRPWWRCRSRRCPLPACWRWTMRPAQRWWVHCWTGASNRDSRLCTFCLPTPRTLRPVQRRE